jgi:TolB protein
MHACTTGNDTEFGVRDSTSHLSPLTFASHLVPADCMRTAVLIIVALALALHVSFSAEAGAPQSKIAFERDSNVWIANIDGTRTRKLIMGDDPRIAPDGTKVAFTMTPPRSKDVERYIAVVDVETGATRIFKDMPSDNCFGPVWSPNGSQILFEIFVDNHWRLGLVNADGSDFQFFKTPFRDQGWSSPCWAPDAKSIYCQDLENICSFGLDGELIAKWEVSKTIPKGDMDSSKRLSVSDDGKKLLIDLNMDEEVSLKDWEGPPPAIWMLDIASGKATRLTPKKSYASDSCWLSDSEILVVDAPRGAKISSIYRVSISDGTSRLVIKNAANPSVSADAR